MKGERRSAKDPAVKDPAGNGPAGSSRFDGAPSEVLVTLENASFGYNGKPVIAGVNLTIARGDFIGLVGPNGAGKTTLLRGLIGQLKPLKGALRAGRGPAGKPVLGYVPQVHALDPIFPVTVEEVVSMGAFSRLSRLGPMPGREKEFRRDCLARVGMDGLGKKPFASLSAGQKQRVLIARAIMTRPDLLLLDEPTSGVDQAAEKTVMQLLAELNGQGLALVLACHELDMVRRTVRDVLWVSRGRIVRGGAEEMLSAGLVNEMFES